MKTFPGTESGPPVRELGIPVHALLPLNAPLLTVSGGSLGYNSCFKYIKYCWIHFFWKIDHRK